jgi:hypothetical protein
MKVLAMLATAALLTSSLVACAPSSPTGPNAAPPTAGAPANLTQEEKIAAGVVMFDLMLAQKDANGVQTPIIPEDIESLSIDGKTVASSEILLMGTNATDNLKPTNLQAALDGKALVHFGGKGIYTFAVAKSANSGNTIGLKLKSESQNYTLIRPAQFDRGTLVLQGGTVRGGLTLVSGFQTAQAGGGLFARYQNMLDLQSYFSNANFDISALLNAYFSDGATVVVTTADNKQFQFTNGEATPSQEETVSADETQKAQQEAQAAVAPPSPLSAYVGKWVLRSVIIPGGSLQIQLRELPNRKFSASTMFQGQTYTGETSYDAVGNADLTEVNTTVAAGSARLTLNLKRETPNQVRVTLAEVLWVDVLNSFVGFNATMEREL